MDINKEETINQLLEAKEAVSIARTQPMLSDEEKQLLEATSLKLHHAERALIKVLQQELIDQLKMDAVALTQLTEKMIQVSSKLTELSKKVALCSKGIEALISGIIAAGKIGLI